MYDTPGAIIEFGEHDGWITREVARGVTQTWPRQADTNGRISLSVMRNTQDGGYIVIPADGNWWVFDHKTLRRAPRGPFKDLNAAKVTLLLMLK